MASNFTLTVLTPNARRVTIKVTTNTTILEVLEDVCKKHDFNPSEWDLTHHNKVIDLGNTLRFSGVPNNGTLEMVEASKTRTESTINLGLQLESGKRLMHSFLPNQTLWEVLDYWTKAGETVLPIESGDAEGIQAVCIYMRQEIVGKNQLQCKTLKSLGLTHGSAMIRLLHRTQGQLKHQANVSAPLSKISVAASSEASTTRKVEPQSKLNSFPLASNQPEVSSSNESEPMDLSQSTEESSTTFSTTTTVESSGTTLVSSSSLEQSKNLISSSSSEMETAIMEIPVGPNVTNAQRYSKEGELHILEPTREALLYHGDDVIVHPSRESLPDDFFNVTIDDVRKIYRDLQTKRRQLEETPLMIQSARELNKDANTLRLLHDHPTTVVRIRFSNRFILQGIFRTADTIECISNWLKGFMAYPEINFYLFTTPPKKLIENETRLMEEGLVGMAVMYFGSEDPNCPQDHKVLKSEFYSKVSAPDAVFDFIHKKLRKEKLARLNAVDDGIINDEETSLGENKPKKLDNIQQVSSSSTSEQQTPSSSSTQKSPRPVGGVTGKTGNTPKWFKTGR